MIILNKKKVNPIESEETSTHSNKKYEWIRLNTSINDKDMKHGLLIVLCSRRYGLLTLDINTL